MDEVNWFVILIKIGNFIYDVFYTLFYYWISSYDMVFLEGHYQNTYIILKYSKYLSKDLKKKFFDPQKHIQMACHCYGIANHNDLFSEKPHRLISIKPKT